MDRDRELCTKAAKSRFGAHNPVVSKNLKVAEKLES